MRALIAALGVAVAMLSAPTAAATATAELLEIPRRNMRTLRGLGKEQVLEMLKAMSPAEREAYIASHNSYMPENLHL